MATAFSNVLFVEERAFVRFQKNRMIGDDWFMITKPAPNGARHLAFEGKQPENISRPRLRTYRVREQSDRTSRATASRSPSFVLAARPLTFPRQLVPPGRAEASAGSSFAIRRRIYIRRGLASENAPVGRFHEVVSPKARSVGRATRRAPRTTMRRRPGNENGDRKTN